MFRSIKEQPLGFMTKVAASITLPSVYLWWANKDDPRMKEIERWEKDIFWIIPTNDWQPISAQDAARTPKGYTRQKPDGSFEINRGKIWRIPKPFELGVAFGSLPERILDAYYQKDPKAFKGIVSSLESAFLPNWKPQAFIPFVENYSNQSTFSGRPLIPKYLEGLLPQYQYNPYTSDTARGIGAIISKIPGMETASGGPGAPIMVENYIRAWTGGLGMHVLSLSDAALRGAGIVPTRISPTLTDADKTGFKAFAVRWPGAGANSIQDFYEESDKRLSVKKTRDYLRKQGDPEVAQQLEVLGAAEGIRKALGTQFKLVRDTYRNPNMSPDEKRQFIDASYLQMIKMAQIGNEMFKKTDEAAKKRKEEQP
jgi:hypothetical protein